VKSVDKPRLPYHFAMPPHPTLPFRKRALGVLGALTSVLAALLVITLPSAAPASPVEPVPDGKSVATAAASCWEIRNSDRTAPSGTYWLWTPALMAPQQFHCDMERQGGGWVLIGRGREGWQTTYNGVGLPDELLAPRADFFTTQLSSHTVDGLIGRRPVSGLREGIRVRRALDAQGSAWQEVRFTLPQRGRWAWSFGAGHPVGRYSFTAGGETVKGTKGNSRRFGSGDGYRRVITSSPEKQDYRQGFAYGPEVTAGPDDNSFLWSSSPGQGYARPYAEMYIRPRLLSTDFAEIPAGGTPAITRRAVTSTWAAPTEWGVTGLASSRSDEGHIEVQAFAEWQGRVFVGGNFTTVQRGRDATGADRIAQPFLAAFDLTTGDFVPGFATQLNGEVTSLEVLPGGRLAVGGAFSRVEGMPATGIVVVDAATGTIDPAFELVLGSSAAPVEVRDLELLDGDLYVSGAFTTAGSGTGAAPAGNAVRVSATTGARDPKWDPGFNDEVNDSAPSPDGSRMYFAGYFTQTRGTATRRAAAISTDTGAALLSRRWQPRWSHPSFDYQRAVAAGQGRIWLGGSQHSLFSFAAQGYAQKSSSLTAYEGGDFQAISLSDGVIYAGCHCNEFNYQDARAFVKPIKGWTQADKISWVGAWTRGGRYVAEFSPLMRSAAGAGVWATMVDSTGTLWAGGDLRSVQTGQTTSQWLGSFARFPMQDHRAPGMPGSPSAVTQSGDRVQVSWLASTDETSQVSYEVLRNDRVVAVTAGTSVEVPGRAADDFYVRAVDENGNRSASTAAVRPV
jgi:hypothetical protein